MRNELKLMTEEEILEDARVLANKIASNCAGYDTNSIIVAFAMMLKAVVSHSAGAERLPGDNGRDITMDNLIALLLQFCKNPDINVEYVVEN